MGAGWLLGRTSQLDVELSQIKRQNHMTKTERTSLIYHFKEAVYKEFKTHALAILRS